SRTLRGARVRGDPTDLDDDFGAATMTDADVPRRRLADHDEIRAHFRVLEEVEHPPPTPLLVDGVADEEIARGTVVDEVRRCIRLDREWALDVHCAPAMEVPACDHAAEG